jgi:hypothetical protein
MIALPSKKTCIKTTSKIWGERIFCGAALFLIFFALAVVLGNAIDKTAKIAQENAAFAQQWKTDQ